MKKIIVISVIALFIVVGFQSAFAVESRVSADNIEKVEDCDCQEAENLNPIRVKSLFTKLKIVTNIILSRFGYMPEVEEYCNDLFDNINSFKPLSGPPILCALLGDLMEFFHDIFDLFSQIGSWLSASIAVISILMYYFVLDIFHNYDCEWTNPNHLFNIKIGQIISI